VVRSSQRCWSFIINPDTLSHASPCRYVLRRVKEKFAEGRTLTGPDAVAALEQGKKEYEMVKRQADVSRMFTGMPSIMQKK